MASAGELSSPSLKWMALVAPAPGWSHLPSSFLDTFKLFSKITVFANWPSGAQERCYLSRALGRHPRAACKKLGQEWLGVGILHPGDRLELLSRLAKLREAYGKAHSAQVHTRGPGLPCCALHIQGSLESPESLETQRYCHEC